jgi:hypothetical protein
VYSLPALVRRDALLHVNLSYSDSHEIFLLAPGDEAASNHKDASQHPRVNKVYNNINLKSDWFSTSRILAQGLAHILLRQVVRFLYGLYRIKNTMKKLPQIVTAVENEFLKFKMGKIYNIFLKK